MYIVEYSVKQKAFHISDVKTSIEKNLMSSLSGEINDYKIIGFCATHEGAHTYIDDLKVRFPEL